MSIKGVRISAVGAYIPDNILSNDDLEKMVDTSDSWIRKRTGIKKRHKADSNQFTSDLAIKALRDIESHYDMSLSDIDYLIVATFTPDHYMPSVASRIQGQLGLPSHIGVLDINAACAGFVHGLYIASSFINSGLAKKVVVVGAEVLSKIVDYSDRNTCVLFGDGAAAVLLEKDDDAKGILSYHYGAQGDLGEKLYCSGISNKINNSKLDVENRIHQDGRAVYNYVMKNIPNGVGELLKKADLEIEDINWFIPHSANLRMIHFLCDIIGLEKDRTLTSVEEYGNTSAASIPIALWMAERNKKIKKKDKILLYGFGGGLNHAGCILNW